ncbi:MAG TPA: glycosyltransferase family 2 protein [Bryobacteraceae bacterium]|nr:glycosyltransferase family 2 protein [Bryobacteraceae bacterium]
MSISAIVPVWNGRELVERLLATLDAQTRRADEVIVVDNGSTDGAPEMAAGRGARVIRMGRNAGFAAAVNRGIRESRGEWIAVLNSDVELAPEYLAALVACDAWFATGKILRAGASAALIDGTFDLLCRGGCAWRVGSGRADGPLFSPARPIFSPPWTAVLFRAEVFRRAGYLEESFESYLEDVDFGLRCAALGLQGVYEPRAVAWHRGSVALGRWHPETVRLIARNQVLLLARHYPRKVLFRCGWHILVGQLLWGAVALRHGRGPAWLRGKWQGLQSYSAARRNTGPFDPEVLDRLCANERTIREVQTATGFDLYWRLYFLLTGGGAK